LSPRPGDQKCSAKTIWRLCKYFKISELAFQAVEDEPKVPVRSGSKVRKYPDFTFVSLNDDGTIPIDELAWYAAHRPEDFSKEAASIIERFTRDEELTRLLTELNAEAEAKPSNS
jgi:hypothetical protein